MGEKMGMDVDLVQRKTYGETSELVGNGGIDLAFICSGPYATGKGKYGFELLVQRHAGKCPFLPRHAGGPLAGIQVFLWIPA
jgi:ABC-type phosphate/phosphonate transport system substrate-binding protein